MYIFQDVSIHSFTCLIKRKNLGYHGNDNAVAVVTVQRQQKNTATSYLRTAVVGEDWFLHQDVLDRTVEVTLKRPPPLHPQ